MAKKSRKVIGKKVLETNYFALTIFTFIAVCLLFLMRYISNVQATIK